MGGLFYHSLYPPCSVADIPEGKSFSGRCPFVTKDLTGPALKNVIKYGRRIIRFVHGSQSVQSGDAAAVQLLRSSIKRSCLTILDLSTADIQNILPI